MSHLSISPDDGDSIVTLGDRMLGLIHPVPYLRPRCIVCTDHGAEVVAIPVADEQAGIELFEKLTHIPADEECFCGDVTGVQVDWMGHVNGPMFELYASSAEKRRGDAGFSVVIRMDINELHELHNMITFGLARLAVQS